MSHIRYPIVKWKCISCGNCCRNHLGKERMILLTDSDIEMLLEGGQGNFFVKNAKALSPYKYEMLKNKGACVFLLNNRCRVYNRRPLICRFYPFAVKENNGYLFDVDLMCSGIGIGKTVNKKYFNKLIQDAKNAMKIEQYKSPVQNNE